MKPASETPALFPFDNSYARLPERFYAKLAPTPVKAPKLIRLNVELARDLGLDPVQLASPEGVAFLAGAKVPPGADPLAAAYAGHQFGNFTPQLGDGRAILLGEVIGCDGVRRDIQLKGSGPTPFSRRGDGRAALGPVLREYVLSEAFAALGIPTTRALAAVTTGEEVWRDTPVPGAVFTRVAASHIRVGTFQYFAARGDVEGIKTLVDHVIARHYPAAAIAANKYRALLDAVIARQAKLIAQWLGIGFIHGVMNTDNMSIAGETIDFGPCAFMDAFHPGMVYSSIDHAGRYAYANQPRIAQWNLARLAETLLPLFDEDKDEAVEQAQASLNAFSDHFQRAYTEGLRRKLGLLEPRDGDLELAQELLQCMADGEADFTNVFRGLCDAAGDTVAMPEVRSLFPDPAAFDGWLARWHARLAAEGGEPAKRRTAMRLANPAFIPRNHLVEEVIQAAVKESDFAPFERLVTVLSKPYDDQPDAARYALPPRPEQVVHQTFCGT
jgi:serine/tyrosine/threonine adenylyltransferase